MNSICLDALSLFGALQFMPYLSLGDTIVVFIGEGFEIWRWLDSKGGWCLEAYMT